MKTGSRSSLLIAVVVILAGFGIMKMLSGMKKPPKVKEEVKGVKSVYVLPVLNDSVQTSQDITGPLLASNRIEIYAEVNGILKQSARSFKEGIEFKKGELLMRMDDAEARLTLISQRSAFQNLLTRLLPDLKLDFSDNSEKWEQYLASLDPEKTLPALPEHKSRKEKNFLTSRDVYTQYYSIRSQEERLSKFSVVAPFTGVLSEVMINEGALVRAGQKAGTFIGTESFEMEATIPLAVLPFVKNGDRVELKSEDIPGVWVGSLKRISSKLDPSTQTVKVFVAVQAKELREGMYMSGLIQTVKVPNAFKIARKLLLPENEVYIVVENVLKKVPVEIVRENRSSVVVRGIPDHALLMSESIPGAFDGMEVSPVNQ